MALPQSSEIRPADVACLGACRLDQGHAERQRYTMFSKFSTRTWRLLGKKDESAVSKEDRCGFDGRAQRVDRWQLRVEQLGGPLAIPSRAARLVARSCRGVQFSEKSCTMGVGGDGMQLGSTWRVAHQSDRSELDGESKPDQGV